MKSPIRINRGFSMIEVLVTMLIIAVALLGSAGLQAYALKTNQGGQLRNQAAFFVSDIVERMTANKAFSTGAQGYNSNLIATVDCTNANCTPAELAAYDLASWQNSIVATLSGGAGSITQVTVGNPATYDILVSWTDRKTNVNYATNLTAPKESFAIRTTVTIRN